MKLILALNISVLIFSSITDIKYKKIPNVYVLLITAAFFSYRAYLSLVTGVYTGLYEVLLCVAGLITIPLIMLPSELITKKSFGAGDKKMLMALSLSLGAWSTLYVTLGMLAGAGFFSFIKKAGRDRKIAMAPFILASYTAVCVLGL